ncbi:ABC transporter ATP-binding protein [Rhizobium oryzicola]|uniref:ABC transporter ATP-binding protein n=1 Tax=Rhizobium oryzicola TaxID=1232668 RepID=A0ABT8T4C2_9HYPH|nr:ABC transporter ATP-binding protein [Rhizobium oryzicola]MDO1585600.1 ABC transporter ATP-binding protein [Rhizobium oryzicola]
MNQVVMSVDKVGKVFRRYRHEMYRVLGWFSGHVRGSEDKWVLRDISFDVEAGQALAIVGRNGAGKSTLLKLITGTMRASEGRISLSGKISAILELGMGFNPDYTGRQNVFHALGLMGYQHGQIVSVMPEIEAFSELGSYFDQPLRVYSSGMHMRLAFSVATAFRPDILIVDEALSVGDAYFQHKSFDKIKDFRRLGTTLILVSHDRMALLSLCDRAILLHEGAVALDGDPESVLDYYNALLGQKDATPIETETQEDGRVRTSSGSRKVSIVNAHLEDIDGREIDTLDVAAEAVIKVKARANENVETLVFGYAIKDRFGQTLYGTNTYYSGQALEGIKAGEEVEFAVRFRADLGPGTYSVALALVGGENHIGENYEWRDLALIFDVANASKQTFDGRIYLPSEMTVTRG